MQEGSFFCFFISCVTFPPRLMSNGSLLAIQGHLWCYFKGNLLQFGMDDVIFLQKYSVKVKNSFLLAESQRQRRFLRKPHIKSSFRSGGVVTW